MTKALAIEANGLEKHYGDEQAVHDLRFSIDQGTIYGFLGPNGAGKTSTIRMLTTLTRPSGGSARIMGHSVEDRAAVTPHIGYLPEEPPLYDELTAREQLTYIAGLRDLPSETAAERIGDLLARFDLTDDADDRISTYSKGMKQKTGIIQALLHDPAVVFLDEPTSGLDPRAARTVRETIADLAAGDSTVLLSTHILPVVEDIADTVGVLSDGTLVAEGAPDRLKTRVETGTESSLEDVFLELTEDRTNEREARPAE
ncbi:ABC transporter ATP-binding protein [Halococcus thailandensis]|uniref:Daunorubicin resistance ABC transporter ATP-binding protein n=1 Tax=Halococcus thailandensis JCM 13552 TaxID=1227457 RepID=M0NIR8_9EURY|nr:ABC transporter ATP-binding protein [Halococcus thailandensis]EMA56555.1 daunorubicin resistance ABC transporter ATP-binding protein [Halococcus thailandensis JCM 13552]